MARYPAPDIDPARTQRMRWEHRLRIAATRVDIPFAEYRAHVEAGERYCSHHHVWHPMAAMSKRSSKPDGLDNVCREVVNARATNYQRRRRAQDPAAYNAMQAAQKRRQRAMARQAQRRAS